MRIRILTSRRRDLGGDFISEAETLIFSDSTARDLLDSLLVKKEANGFVNGIVAIVLVVSGHGVLEIRPVSSSVADQYLHRKLDVALEASIVHAKVAASVANHDDR